MPVATSTSPRSSVRRAPLPVALLLMALLGAVFATPAEAEAERRIGVGILYLDATDDVFRDGFAVDGDSVAAVLSYQYRPEGLFSFELDLEIYPDGGAGAETFTAAPVAFLLVGKGLYAGIGVGVFFSSDFSDNVSDPFFAARVGFNFTLLPRIAIDVNANWRADAFNQLDDVDVDAITLGASLRFTL